MLRIIGIILVAVFGYSGYQLWLIHGADAQEAGFHSQLMKYKPAQSSPMPSVTAAIPPSVPKPEANPQIADLQDQYPDVAGWLTIPNTNIDYPFAQSKDNEYYLHRDLNGQSLAAGTVFMDYRNHTDFSDFNTVIYGHNMKNGSMFGTLGRFNDQAFFDNNAVGTVFLAGKTYTVEFFAYIVLNLDDSIIYDPAVSGGADKSAFLSHVKNTARYYRDIGITTDDHIVTLSTCDYEFNNARMALLGRLAES